MLILLWDNERIPFQTIAEHDYGGQQKLAEREETRLIIEELLEDGRIQMHCHAIEHHYFCENFETLEKQLLKFLN